MKKLNQRFQTCISYVLYSPWDLLYHLRLIYELIRVIFLVVFYLLVSNFPAMKIDNKFKERKKMKKEFTRKQSNNCSSCSGEKSQANFASKSWTFFSIASCLPHDAFQIFARSFCVKACSLIMNRRSRSNFSTYWGWCRQSRRTMSRIWCSWTQAWRKAKVSRRNEMKRFLRGIFRLLNHRNRVIDGWNLDSEEVCSLRLRHSFSHWKSSFLRV